MDKSKYVLDVQVEAPTEKEAIDKAIQYLAKRSHSFKPPLQPDTKSGVRAPEAPKAEEAKKTPAGDPIEEMKEALISVFEVFGREDAMSLVRRFGGTTKVSEIPLSNKDAFIEACQERFAP